MRIYRVIVSIFAENYNEMKATKPYIVSINGIIQQRASTSLLQICKWFDLCYSSASRGKHTFTSQDENKMFTTIEISRVQVHKIKGRGRKDINKK